MDKICIFFPFALLPKDQLDSSARRIRMTLVLHKDEWESVGRWLELTTDS
jgi:hypothetical protein